MICQIHQTIPLPNFLLYDHLHAGHVIICMLVMWSSLCWSCDHLHVNHVIFCMFVIDHLHADHVTICMMIMWWTDQLCAVLITLYSFIVSLYSRKFGGKSILIRYGEECLANGLIFIYSVYCNTKTELYMIHQICLTFPLRMYSIFLGYLYRFGKMFGR